MSGGNEARNCTSPRLFYLLLLLKRLLLLFFVKIVVGGGKLLHRNQQISNCALKLIPLVHVVKHLQHKTFNLNLVQVGEHRDELLCQQLLHKNFIWLVLVFVFLKVLQANGGVNKIRSVHCLNQLLDYSRLQVETTHMLIVRQHTHSSTKNFSIILGVEHCGDTGFRG